MALLVSGRSYFEEPVVMSKLEKHYNYGAKSLDEEDEVDFQESVMRARRPIACQTRTVVKRSACASSASHACICINKAG